MLLDSEAQAISAETHLPIEAFAESIAGKAPYCFEMKKPYSGKCFFLKDNSCSIYTVRGLICRFYPFELKFDPDQKTHVFDFTVECPAIGVGRKIGKKEFAELFALAEQRLL